MVHVLSLVFTGRVAGRVLAFVGTEPVFNVCVMF